MKMISTNNKLSTKVIILSVLSLTLGILVAIALLTFNHLDPSLNRVVSNIVIHNALGISGAYMSELLLHLFGISSGLIPLILTLWSLVMLKKQGIISLLFMRLIVFIPISIISLSILTAYLINTPEYWDFVNIGGIIGHVFLNILEEYDLNSYAYIPILTIIFALSFFISIGMNIKNILHLVKYIFLSPWYLVYWVYKLLNNRFDHGDLEVLDEDKKLRKKSLVKKNNNSSTTNKISYNLPDLDILIAANDDNNNSTKKNNTKIKETIEELMRVLQDYGIEGKILDAKSGPVVTLYELEPAPGIKSSRVIGLADDIARSMSTTSVRIAVVPGKNVIGMEMPNINRKTVFLRSLLESREYRDVNVTLPIILGHDISGFPQIADLAKMPHLLIAGTTGSGKSVAINTMIMSLLYRLSPEQCKFIMIDPKMLELSVYDGIPHLLTPVVTEPSKAIVALKWVVKEMENRYRLMSGLNVRNITSYNKRIDTAIANNETLERVIQVGFDQDTGKPINERTPIPKKHMPFIVVIVDEMADLMLVAGKEIETSVQRLAQMARAAGIHIIMATQRPSVDVITGVIKANFPTRISFQVTSRIDSRTILGEQGAEQLLGMGDMLYMAGGGKITRIHGPFISDQEVEKISSSIRKNNPPPEYISDVTDLDTQGEYNTDSIFNNTGGGSDGDLYSQALEVIYRDQKVSTSYIQRQLKIGYNKAASIVERMEKEGCSQPS